MARWVYGKAAQKSNYGRKRSQSSQQIYTSGITANHSPKADAQFMASQPIGTSEDD